MLGRRTAFLGFIRAVCQLDKPISTFPRLRNEFYRSGYQAQKKKRCVVASLCAQNAAMRRGSARSQVTHMVFGVDMDSDRQVAAAQIRAALPVNKAPFAGALALDRSASPPSERIAKEA